MKKFLSIVLVSCFSHFIAFASIDSVQYKLKTIKNDSAKLEYLSDKCFQYISNDKSKAKQYCQLMIDLSKNCTNNYANANAYRVAGNYFQEINDYKNALYYYNLAISVTTKLNNPSGKILYAKTAASLGTLYHFNGDFESALKLYLKADSIFSVYHEVNSLIKVYSKLSDLYERLNQLGKSYVYYKKIVKLAEQTTDPQSIANAYISFANSVIDSGKYEIAENYLFRALKISQDINFPAGMSTAFYNLAYLESRRKNYKKALEYNKKVLKIAVTTQSTYDECDALNKIGRNNFFLGDFKTAQLSLKKGITLARKYAYKELLRKHLDVAVSVEDTLGNYRKALYFREEYTSLYLETVDNKVQQQVNFLDAKYQSQKREGQIKELENEKQIRDLQLFKRQQWIVGLFIIIGMLMVLTIFIHLNNRNKRKITQQALDIKEQKIFQMEKDRQLVATQSVLQGEEAERSRMARDLHDGLGGLLSGVKLSLSNMKGNMVLSTGSLEKFDHALSLLDTSIRELRRVAHNMMPGALVNFGLREALSDFCSSINNNNTIHLNFQFFGVEKRIDPSFEINTFRIAQELINNALKHSNSTELMIQLIQEEKRVHLTVQDNGKGFDTSHIASGTGLNNIKSRVESLKGLYDLVSEPGKGTEVSVEFILES